MTTTVKIHVNGRYRTTVIQTDINGKRVAEEVIEGNYEGSSNPSGEKSFWLTHPAHGTFEIHEEYIPEEK